MRLSLGTFFTPSNPSSAGNPPSSLAVAGPSRPVGSNESNSTPKSSKSDPKSKDPSEYPTESMDMMDMVSDCFGVGISVGCEDSLVGVVVVDGVVVDVEGVGKVDSEASICMVEAICTIRGGCYVCMVLQFLFGPGVVGFG